LSEKQFPNKNWSPSPVKKLLTKINQTGTVTVTMDRKPSSGFGSGNKSRAVAGKPREAV